MFEKGGSWAHEPNRRPEHVPTFVIDYGFYPAGGCQNDVAGLGRYSLLRQLVEPPGSAELSFAGRSFDNLELILLQSGIGELRIREDSLYVVHTLESVNQLQNLYCASFIQFNSGIRHHHRLS